MQFFLMSLKQSLLRLQGGGLLVIAMAATATAQSPADPAVEAAIAGFRASLAPESSQDSRSAAQLQDLSRKFPADPRLMAYAGAAQARLSLHTLLPWRKLRHAEDGLAQVDKSLNLIRPEHEQAPSGEVPNALETRLVAANTYLAVPAMFNRGPRGEKLLTDLLGHPGLGSLPPEFRSAIFFLAAENARHHDRYPEARRYYERVIALNAAEAKTARAALAGLPS